MLRHSSTFSHGFQGLVTKALDTECVSQLPHSNEDLICWHVLHAAKDLASEEEVLGICKDLGRGLGEANKMLDSVVIGILAEVSTVIS